MPLVMILNYKEMPVNDDNKPETAKPRSSRMKKVAAPPPPTLKPPISNGRVPREMTPGEDCAIDELLEGRMDLEVVLPDLSKVRMTVDRRMAMMDLLVQVATANKISPGSHIINIRSKEENSIHYKPNTPIGSLDTNTVYVIPKSSAELPVKKMPKLANQPFEQQTFRLQVNLPRNQRMVLRVSPRCTLAEVKQQICSEKELSHSNHHLVHPAHPETVLDLNSTLEVYGCAEISLMSNSGLRDSIRSTSTSFFSYQRPEEEKKRRGILGLFSRRKKGISLDCSTNGVNSRGVSPSRSEISIRSSIQPKQSTKRKPAPAPPHSSILPQSSSTSVIQRCAVYPQVNSETSSKTDEVGSTVSHSRHSSDSSGYHEPSVFSDCSENKSPDASVVHSSSVVPVPDSPKHKETQEVFAVKEKSSTPVKEPTNLQSIPSCSNVSIISTMKKRKAPQPPAPLPTVESPSDDLPKNLVVEAVISKPSIESSATPSDRPVDKLLIEKSSTPVTSNADVAASVPKGGGVVESADDLAMSVSLSPVSPKPSISPVPSANDTSNSEAAAVKPLEDSNVDSFPAATGPIALPVSNSLPLPPSAMEVTPELHGFISDETASNTGGIGSSPCFTNTKSSVRTIPSTNQRLSMTPVPRPRLSIKRRVLSPATHIVSKTELRYGSCDSGSNSVEMVNTVDQVFKEASEPSSIASDVANITEVEDKTVMNDDVDKGRESSGYDTFSEVEATMAVLDIVINEQMEEQQYEVDFHHASEVSAMNGDVVEQESTVKDSDLRVSSPLSSEVPSRDFVPEKALDDNLVKSDVNQISQLKLEKSMTPTENSPSTAKRKLENFALGYYKLEDKEDIYSSQGSNSTSSSPQVQEPQRLDSVDKANLEPLMSRSDSADLQTTNNNVPFKPKRNVPDVKIVAFAERSQKENLELRTLAIKGQVQQKRAQWANSATLPSNGRSSSLYSLSPPRLVVREISLSECTEVANENPKRTQSDQNLAQDESEVDERQANFIQEQKHLHEEYKKLQAQFLSWQKQLMNNQSLLQNEQIIPQMTFPTFETLSTTLQSPHDGVKSEIEQKLVSTSQQSNLSKENSSKTESLKTRSLPRLKPRPLSVQGGSPYRETSPLHQSASVDHSPITSKSFFTPDSPSETSCDSNVKMQNGTPGDVQPSTSDEHVITEDTVKSANVPTDDVKSQTLPRPKPKPRPNSAFVESGTMTLNRHVRPKSQLVSVTIGSWQQRNQTVNEVDVPSVACMRSKFQSLENIPQEQSKSATPVTPEKKNPVPEPIKEKKEPKSEEVAKVSQKSSTNVTPTKPDNRPKENPRHPAKTEAKMSKMEAIAQSRYPKPLIRISSMKDEVKPPALKACHKWPLGELSEKETSKATDFIREELKAGSKRPAGLGGEKIHRGEVDLRHKSASKARNQTPPRTVPTPPDKAHKVNDQRSDSGSSGSQEVVVHENSTQSPGKFNSPFASSHKDATRPKELYVTTVSISSTIKESSDSKSPKSPKFFPSVSLDESDSKMKTMAELKSVLARKTLEREAAASIAKSSSGRGLKPKEQDLSNGVETMTATPNQVESVTPPPPPPPPTSTIPSIPPAASVPVSSQLLMGTQPKGSSVKREPKKLPKARDTDPREELMLEIRGFGGKHALRKLFQRSTFSLLKKSPKKKTSTGDSTAGSSKS